MFSKSAGPKVALVTIILLDRFSCELYAKPHHTRASITETRDKSCAQSPDRDRPGLFPSLHQDSALFVSAAGRSYNRLPTVTCMCFLFECTALLETLPPHWTTVQGVFYMHGEIFDSYLPPVDRHGRIQGEKENPSSPVHCVLDTKTTQIKSLIFIQPCQRFNRSRPCQKKREGCLRPLQHKKRIL
jgi:hypothetical protein